MHDEPKLVVILGQTATGKTDLAIDVAKKYNGEIICADSLTVYEGMDIGAAKPSKEQQKEVKHHLLDIIEPSDSYNVVDFKTDCIKTIDEIRRSGKLPIIVGGSGMYIDALIYDYQFRSSTDLDISDMSTEQKLELAQKLYPKEFNEINTGNIRRIEQLLTRGPSKNNDRDSIKIPCKIIGLKLDKLTLKQNIEKRTQSMLNNGFVQEVKKLQNKYGEDCAALYSTGYAQVNDFLKGMIKESELKDNIVTATLKLAKKQATWFKRNQDIEWVGNKNDAIKALEKYLEGDFGTI